MASKTTRSPATLPQHTFDVMAPPSLAPRVAYHDQYLSGFVSQPVPDAVCRLIPIEAFGPVASLARQRYFTHDNGGLPYLILIDAANKRATLRSSLTNGSESDDEEHPFVTYNKLVKRISYERFWNGYAPWNDGVDYENAIGNTLLFEEVRDGRQRYILVAGKVFAFELPVWHPPIEHFCAPIGNSDVPYPYAWSKKFAYLLVETDFAFTELKNVAQYVKTGDIASLFYGHRDWKTGIYTSDMKKAQKIAMTPLPQKTMPVRVIHQTLFAERFRGGPKRCYTSPRHALSLRAARRLAPRTLRPCPPDRP